MKREHWKSRFGFMWAAIGSAIGLGSIWRFPYVVGENGGALFILIFALCLLVVGIPTLLAEIVIGRKTHLSPEGAFCTLGHSKKWGQLGAMTVLTGFIISSFYSVIAGWTLGYLVQTTLFGFGSMSTNSMASEKFVELTMNPFWTVGYHAGFMALSGGILYYGIQKGIESWNKILMPLLMILLLGLVSYGLTLPNAKNAISFLLKPDLSEMTPKVVIMALGQAFFGLSLGQGTMVTYGSYLTRKENILKICLPIASSVIIVSILAGIAIYTTVFAQNIPIDSGPNLMFKVLPLVFSKMAFGRFFGFLFFLLIFLAGLTSQISAMEPTIAYFMEKRKYDRKKAVILCATFAFLLGIPSALSFGLMKDVQIFDMNFFEWISYASINILVPVGGFLSVILLGYKVSKKETIDHLDIGADGFLKESSFLKKAFIFNIRYVTPVLIFVILLNLLGII
jgi:NSS family neurotransmitter:Na+ symporter